MVTIFYLNLESGGNDILEGGAGNDFVRAESGHRTIKGDTGNDLLLGEEGKNFIDGGLGINILSGGGGSDRFSLLAGGFQAITDFTDGEDFLVLEEGLTFEQINVLPTLIGTSIQVAETGEHIAALISVAPDLISAEDFKEAGEPAANIVGTNSASATQADNVRQGTSEDDVIEGIDGEDFLNGGDGDDFINGDRGDDVSVQVYLQLILML